jgi:curved DNA-binding protein CbpA
MNYYIVLGVPDDADTDLIRSAFRTLVRRYHPDAGAGSSVEKFRQVLAAYETLNDPVSRRQHDRRLRGERARVSDSTGVEPLIPTESEPLLGKRRRASGRPAGERFPPVPLDQLIDVYVRLWEDVF